jgi:hypothetical protein
MHLRARTVAGTVVLLALAACSAPAGGTPEQISAWIAEQDAADHGTGTLGTATSRVGPGDPEPSAGTGITLEYDAPARVDAVRVSCFGDGTLDFTVATTSADDHGGSTTRDAEVTDVACGGDPVEIPLDATGVTAVRTTGSGADRTGAWHAEILGTQPA